MFKSKKIGDQMSRLLADLTPAGVTEKQAYAALMQYYSLLDGVLDSLQKPSHSDPATSTTTTSSSSSRQEEDAEASTGTAATGSKEDKPPKKELPRMGTAILRPFSSKEAPLEEFMVSQEVLNMLIRWMSPKVSKEMRTLALLAADATYFILSKTDQRGLEGKLAQLVPAICEGLGDGDPLLDQVLGAMWNLTNIKAVSELVCSAGHLGRLITLLNVVQGLKQKVRIISAVANISATEECRKILIQEKAVDWLLPTMFSKDAELRMKAGMIIGNIACSKTEGVVEYVKQTGALERLTEYALTQDPRLASSGTWLAVDVVQFVSMCENTALTPVQIFGAHMMVQVIYQVKARRDKFQVHIIGETETRCLTNLAATTTNPAARALAIQGLCHLGSKLPLDVLNPTGHAFTNSTTEPPPSYASLEPGHGGDDAHASAAAAAHIAALTEENARLRKVMADIQSMLAVNIPPTPRSVAAAGGEKAAPMDVFISYRRATGSQLASLLKVHLSLRGFRVFLDVDLLGKGTFDDALLENVEKSINFISLLTEGSLDRCMVDTTNSDWVRKEIALAINKKKNLVPVFLSGFKFPEATDLPEDIRPLLRHNSVEWIHGYQSACVDKIVSFMEKRT